MFPLLDFAELNMLLSFIVYIPHLVVNENKLKLQITKDSDLNSDFSTKGRYLSSSLFGYF